MSFDQVTRDENAESNPHALAPVSVSGITRDPVNMDVLNSFEDLQLGDGSDLIVELIDLYLQELPQRVTEIRETSIRTDWALLKLAAHTLKGSSGSLGVRHVAEICEKLEHMDSHDSPTAVAALIQLLEYESAMASSSLAALRQRRRV